MFRGLQPEVTEVIKLGFSTLLFHPSLVGLNSPCHNILESEHNNGDKLIENHEATSTK